MTEAPLPQWSDEVVAASFRAEIQARFEAHNVAFRAKEAIELEEVLRKHPDKTGQPGYEVRDSGAWRTYQECEIWIDRNTVTIVLPLGVAIGVDFVHMFDHTSVAWSSPSIGAMIVDGEARPTIEIVLVATWDDAMDAAWKGDPRRNRGRQLLVDIPEAEARQLCDHLARTSPDPTSDLLVIRDRLLLELEVIL